LHCALTQGYAVATVAHLAVFRSYNLENILLVDSVDFGKIALFMRMKGFAVS